MESTRPTRIEIDTEQARLNFRYVREHLNAGTKTTFVLKANAYGHGSVEMGKLAEEEGYDSFAVAMPEEAVPLREAGITLPIYILGLTLPTSFDLVVETNVIPAVSECTDLVALNAAGKRKNKVISCMLAINTGMNRIGVPAEKALDMVERIKLYPNLKLRGFFTHMANGDSPDQESAKNQIKLFKAMFYHIQAAYPGEEFVFSMNNSAGTLAFPESQFNSVRPGIILYGINPLSTKLDGEGVKPFLSLKSRVTQVVRLPGGVSIGYGSTYTLPNEMTIATIPIGYADGYPRILSNRGSVLIGGARCPVVGRICMDMLMVAVPDEVAVKVGDDVVLIGTQGEEEITVNEIARLADTIPYEIFTGLSLRVPRIYY